MLQDFSSAYPFEPLGTDLAFLEVGCCMMVTVDYVLEFDVSYVALDFGGVVFASSALLLAERFAKYCWRQWIIGG